MTKRTVRGKVTETEKRVSQIGMKVAEEIEGQWTMKEAEGTEMKI